MPFLLIFFEQDAACKKFYDNINTDAPLFNKENQFHCEEVDSNVLKIQATGEEVFFYNFYYTLADVLSFDDYAITRITVEGDKGSSDIAFILVAGGIKKEKIVISSSSETEKFKNEHKVMNEVLSKMKALSA